MQIPKSLLPNALMLALGLSFGFLLSTKSQPPSRLDISFNESQVQRSIDLLSDLSNGGPNAAKHRIDFELKFALKQINIIAKEKGSDAERAKVVQKVVSKWRSDNSSMTFDPDLAKEIQIASTQSQ